MEKSLDDLLKEREEILQNVKNLFGPQAKEALQRLKEVERQIRIFQKEKEIDKEIKELKEMLQKEKDPEMQKLIKEEFERLEKEKEKLKEELKEESGIEEIIIEIRPGAGGEEACLWAKDLFSLYQKFIQKKGFEMKIFDLKETSLGGIKKVVFQVKGRGVFKIFLNESGVHRVQRIPKTEKGGRIHTSTASIAVLKIPKKDEIKILPKDLKIETFRASGPGGQYVNKRATAVRITHLPSGIQVSCQTSRNQLQNKENALKILKAKLYQKEMEKIEAEISRQRREQIKRGERAEKIRTYNFVESRVTDHRLKKTWRNLKEILEGELDEIIQEFEKGSTEKVLEKEK
jgi:peptide chain release factor 1